MSDATADAAAAGAATEAREPARRAGRGPHLHGPVLDFLCLGGGSIPVMLGIALLVGEEHRPVFLLAVIAIGFVINQPHFMHSYQIFYHGFGAKIADRGSPLRHRYVIAGIVVPAALLAFFAICVALESPAALGQAANVMFFLVGWHYAKQGYGILIVESVMRRAFFSDREKDLLRLNALVAWIFSWLLANRVARSHEYNGLAFSSFDFPDWLVWGVGAVAVVTGAAMLGLLVRRMADGRLPVNGALGYISAIYLWMLLVQFDPILILLGPVFHSLQYIAVVWRYQLNREARERGTEPVSLGAVRLSRAQLGLARFFFLGVVAGICGFWAFPMALDAVVAYKTEIFGTSLFMFMAGIFINVHHYFMDNVMWRRENPDIRENLFG